MADSPIFDAADHYAEISEYGKAIAEYERALERSIGTELEPTARLLLANEYKHTASQGNYDAAYVASLLPKYVEQLDQVIQRFSGTPYAFVAKAMKLESLPHTKFDLDPVLTEVHARPMSEILDDIPDPPFHERMIPQEFRYHVAEAYDHLMDDLTPQEQTKLQLFLIEGFPESDWYSDGKDFFLRDLIPPTMSIDGVPPGMPSEPDSLAPRILSRFPEPGQRTGLQPEIRVTLVDGDHWARQASAKDSRLRLDGTDVTNFAFWKVRFDTSSTALNFQELTLIYKPLLPLPAGEHTLEMTASEGGREPNSETYQWKFIVDSNSGGGPTTNQTLQVSKDALVYEKSPHSNEGANPKLTLEKITGKASRNLLGFNLSGINAATVSKATLVLTIDPSDQATGWGSGDTVNVKPVTVAWQEGNGKSYGLSSSQQTAGSGAGTTWFSPTDDNISNNSSNSVTQWSGGATYATAGAAPPLTVQNHQTGELRFNVTADVRAGAVQGWLLRKDAENKGSKVTFYSKEGAAAAGNPALAPRLILEFGSTTTQAPTKSWLAIVLDLMEQGYRQLQAYWTPPAPVLSWLDRAIN